MIKSGDTSNTRVLSDQPEASPAQTVGNAALQLVLARLEQIQASVTGPSHVPSLHSGMVAPDDATSPRLASTGFNNVGSPLNRRLGSWPPSPDAFPRGRDGDTVVAFPPSGGQASGR